MSVGVLGEDVRGEVGWGWDRDLDELGRRALEVGDEILTLRPQAGPADQTP